MKMIYTMDSNGVLGGLITLFLFVVAKVTLSDLASIATILSGCTVIAVNLPKLFSIYHQHIKPLFKK